MCLPHFLNSLRRSLVGAREGAFRKIVPQGDFIHLVELLLEIIFIAAVMTCLISTNYSASPVIFSSEDYYHYRRTGSTSEKNNSSSQSLLSNINDDNDKINSKNIAQIKRNDDKRKDRSRLDEEIEAENEDETFGYHGDNNSIDDCLLRPSEVTESSYLFHKYFYGKLNHAHNEGLAISAKRNAAILKQQWM